MRLNFTVYGSQYTYGWLPEGAKLISAPDFVREAIRRGFSGAEVPARTLESATANDLRDVRSLAEKHGLELIVSAFGTEVEYLATHVRHADAMGSKLVRTVVGGAGYGGDRRQYAGGKWAHFMTGVTERLAHVVREASKRGIGIAVENHQDVASEDLLALCHSYETEYFGIVLDTANPLATAEHPITFAKQLMPYIKYVHLKDYNLYWSDEGYRLVRCPVGSGVVPFRELIPLLKQHGRGASASLELAALEQRHVRVFASDWWPEYAVRPATQLAECLAFVQAHARPKTEDYRTPFERGESPAQIAAYEETELREAIRLTASLSGDPGPSRALQKGYQTAGGGSC